MPSVFCWARLAGCLWLLVAAADVHAAPAVIDWFDTNHVLEISVQIAPADWNVLRYQHRESDFFPEENAAPATNAYTWFPANVTVDDQVFPGAKVRKKGYIGSNDPKRPGLKLLLAHSATDPKANAPELTLNNNNQDPALVRQCLAYQVFARAGVPAPRCSFARVTVNGTVLGVYTHVEDFKKPFLKRCFGRDEGQLYEGGRSDFRSGWYQNFEIKSEGEDHSRSDLAAATKAIEDPNGSLLAALERYLDLNEFLHYWAVESLIGDRDGYAANANNYYVYHNPATDKFVFIPWGKDTVMYPGSGRGGPNSVIGVGILANRLYNSPEGRDRYRAVLREVLRTAWNEHDLLAETDRLEHLLKPVVVSPTESFLPALQGLRLFITQRRSQVEPELAGPAPELPAKPMPIAKRRNVGHIEAHFSLAGSGSTSAGRDGAASASLKATLYGKELEFEKVDVQETATGRPRNEEAPMIMINAARGRSGRAVYIYLAIDPESYAPNVTLPVDNTHVSGQLMESDPNGQIHGSGGMLRGSLRLRAAGHDPNAPTEGDLTADVFSKMPEP